MKNLIAICICLLAYFQSLGQSEYSSSVINIGVVVSDLDRSMDFYQNILGMIKVNLYDITPEMGSKTGLSDGIPFKAEVLKVEDIPNATEWKLMSF
jgi:catechol-2,3-dioxygenase